MHSTDFLINHLNGGGQCLQMIVMVLDDVSPVILEIFEEPPYVTEVINEVLDTFSAIVHVLPGRSLACYISGMGRDYHTVT